MFGNKKKNNLPLVATIIICSLLISGSLIFLGLQIATMGSNPANLQIGQNRGDNLEEYLDEHLDEVMAYVIDDAVLGNSDAQVTIVEYSDYQCPFCRSFYENAYQEIKSEYIDTGLVKMIFRDFPLPFHDDAIFAANAAKCAKKEAGDEAYYAFHDLIFEKQGSAAQGTQAITDSMIANIAKDLNINTRNFRNCVNDNEFYVAVAADYLAATLVTANRIAAFNPETGEVEISDLPQDQRIGVRATPTVFINDIKVVGAQPFEVFQMAIEAALNE
jgi:protein-disulfide isomerase